MVIKFNKKFKKQYDKADLKIQLAFDHTIKLFLQNPFHPSLRNQQLSGKLKLYRSINITGNWKALYSESSISNKTIIIFEMLGTHSHLYK
ncbi:MAG TPA: type II toxin-antitoxin system mRNA interferase toxin, RelE/StbE family [Candidatus Woesebacteria bacterium]|nr:type II toxin-antitoxin system mRNA interferase toxin, RelE/StbE family [Candidatus Woesebacteria bacterium]